MCTCYLVRSHGNYTIHVNMWNMFCAVFISHISLLRNSWCLYFLFYEKIHCVTGLKWLYSVSVSFLHHQSFTHSRTIYGYCYCIVNLHFCFCHLSFWNTHHLCVALCVPVMSAVYINVILYQRQFKYVFFFSVFCPPVSSLIVP